MSGREHEVKCWPSYFDAVVRKKKRFEVHGGQFGIEPGHVVLSINLKSFGSGGAR